MLFMTVIELGIYRKSPEGFTLETENLKLKETGNLEPDFINLGDDQQLRELRQLWEKSFYLREGYSWLYNDLIGFLQVKIGRDQLRGEIHMIKAKRIRRNRKRKTFQYYGKGFEFWFSERDSNKEISDKLEESIKSFAGRKDFKTRYLHSDPLTNILAFVDWKGIASTI